MPNPPSEEQIRVIYRETIDTLYAAVSRRCDGDRDLTEDVVQEAWLRAVREWRTSGLPRSPLAWLMTVSRNLLLNDLRRRPGVPLDSLGPGQTPAAADDSEHSASREAFAAVHHALDRLPPKQSQLLRAFHFERLRVSQIADRLGLSERAVEGRLRRARENLRTALKAVLE